MMFEWIEKIEEQLPEAEGFGRLVDVEYQYWKAMNSSTKLDGKKLLERAGEMLKVSRMYGIKTDRVKFTCFDRTLYLMAPAKSAVCVVLPRPCQREEAEIWSALELAHELAPVEFSS